MEKEVTLEVNDQNLENIVQKVEEGTFRIPEFQREYVWDSSDVVDLLDSVYNNYPIGSIFLWRVPDNMTDFFRDIRTFDQPNIEDMNFSQTNFVLDGQQRLTSFYLALQGIETDEYDYGNILFDLDNRTFKRGKGTADHLVKVSDIWDSKTRFSIAREVEEERSDALLECANVLESYTMPLIIVQSKEIEKVIDIFERINQKGQSLDRFDLVNANVWSESFNLRIRIDEDIQEPLENDGFGMLSRDTVTQSLALNILGNCKTKNQKTLTSNQVEAHWDETVDAILNAIDYLKDQFNIRQIDFIPYHGQIPVIAYYLYQSDRSTIAPAHQDFIHQWFWRVGVSDHWEKKTQAKMSQDCNLVDELLEGHSPSLDFPITVTKESLVQSSIKRTTSAVRNELLCVIANQHPRDFEDNTEINLSKNDYTSFKAHKHHIFPNNYLKSHDINRSKRRSVVNFTFLPETVNESLGDKAPSVYFDNLRDKYGSQFEEIMDSHLIPYDEDSGIWEDDYDKFLNQRSQLLLSEILKLAGGNSAQIGEEPVVERVESAKELLYVTIIEELSGQTDPMWSNVPNDSVSQIEEELNISDINDGSFTEAEKLASLPVIECYRIMDFNWTEFEAYFPSRDDMKHYLSNIEEFDSELSEGSVDQYTEIDGGISARWIRSCLAE